MAKILITGGTGQLGRLTIRALLRTIPPDQIATLARDPMKCAAFRQEGIDIRRGDFFDTVSLTAACRGVKSVFLVSAVGHADRVTQHRNVIAAARTAGVEHIVYSAMQRLPQPVCPISNVTEVDRVTEQALQASGMRVTILRNCLYADLLPLIIGSDARARGVRVPPGDGVAPVVTRADLADAHAAILTQAGHEGRTYTLGASEACSFADIAAYLGVTYAAIPLPDYVAERAAAGLGAHTAAFLAEWVQAVTQGEFAEVTGDLERLIGRTPTSYREFLRTAYQAA